MRPLQLTLQAFSSYQKKTVIDFRQLGQNGIFVIWGNTGSGKTTLFDGISYALYGEQSGQELHRPFDFRNRQEQDRKVETIVELEFENKGLVYTVHRSFKLKKDGSDVHQKCYLALPDGKSLSKQAEINEKIKDIIGLDKKQFRQVVMIAQGTFRDILLKKGNERAELLKTVFDVSAFSSFIERSKKEVDYLQKEVNETKKEIERLLEEVHFQLDGKTILEELNLLKNKQEFDYLRYQEIVSKLEQIDLTLQEQNIQKQKFLDQQKNRLDYKKAQEKKLMLEKDYQSLEARWQTFQKECNEDFFKQKEKELNQLKEQLSLYQVVDELEIKLKQQTHFVKEAQTKLILKQDSLVHQQKEQEDFKNIDEKLGQQKLLVQKREMDLEKESLSLNEFQQALSRKEAYEKNKMDYQKHVKEYQDLQQEYGNLQQEYEFQQSRFLQEQAGILAENLQEGKPCPVCGSLHHPKPTPKGEKVYNQSQIQFLKEKVQTFNQKRFYFSQRMSEEKTSLKHDEKSLKEMAEKYSISMEEWTVFYTKLQKQYRQSKKELQTQKSILKDNEQQKEVFRQRENSIHELRKEIEQDQVKLQEEKLQLKSIHVEYHLKKKDLPLFKKEEAEEKYREEQRLLANLTKKKKQYQDDLQQGKLSLVTLVAQIETLSKQLKEELVFDFNQLVEEIKLNSKLREELDHQKQTLYARLQRIEAVYTRVKHAYQKQEAKMQALVWKQDITKYYVRSGEDGNKLSLDAYVLSLYLDQILGFANERFQQMADGQYALVRTSRKSGQSEQTLALDIQDLYSGQSRPVHTLSGGEAFMASLSLALGMADAIRSLHGGIEMETIFIDEGFGSLDQELLKKVMLILEKTAGNHRLVGIISHVQELKERVEKKIIVTKEFQTGSTIKIIGE
ncbi:AAA family ATPase [Bulleidia sp. zg-1006]|uniref:AAA family ATPase n=1 Tax=Bulleidia sp. zg-1006 TaxID=2806552 RepID=UPI00193A44AD|nr:SMC family ATPase [Bulleidia sp. zg-1006]QRG86566.1 SMC family ATPase [Bulleidia sp. zg-1006]